MSRLALADGGALHYEVHGDGPALLLIAGLGGLGGFWRPLVEPLAQRYSVVIHDHRGTGRSSHDRIGYSIAQMTADVVALMDALAIPAAHVVGHSTGGAIGQTLALDHPERLHKLVLSATWARPDPYITALFELRAEILERDGLDAYARLGALLTFPPDWIREHGAPDTSRAAEQVPDTRIALSRIRALLAFDRSDSLAAITAPTLVIHARDDQVIPPGCCAELAAAIPGARAVIEPDGGHFLPVTRPERYLGHLLGFL